MKFEKVYACHHTNFFITLDQNAFIVLLSSDELSALFTTSVLPILFFRYYRSLEIMNENGDSFGKYCGNTTGQVVVVYGSLVVLRFSLGYHGSYGRFRLLYTPTNCKYNNKI